MKNYVTTYDPFFDLFFGETRKNNISYIMDTDIIEKDDRFEMKVNLPLVNKDDIKISLDKGYLNLAVTLAKENKEEKDHYILKERNYGSYSRSYYVGEDVHFKDISAKLDNGILLLTIKKVVKEEEKERFIEIQ